MRTFIIGDIHGRHDKLVACLKLVNFDYENDKLIQLGDVVDRGTDSYECVEELLKIKNLIAIKGNHDDCFYESIRLGGQNVLFYQGGKKTLESYIKNCNPECQIVLKMSGYYTDFDYDDYPPSHIKFFKDQLPYYIDENNNLFVHAGIIPNISIELQEEEIFLWDRTFWTAAVNAVEEGLEFTNSYNRIFIGHTPTPRYGSDLPMQCGNIWNLDTGCGKSLEAKLTIMNLETKEFWQA